MTDSSEKPVQQKLEINEKSLHKIKEYAIQEFHNLKGYGTVDAENARVLLLFEGLFRLLKQHGIEPNFEVRMRSK